MNALVLRRGVLVLAVLVGTNARAERQASPTSWSPDGEWLAYVTKSEAGQSRLKNHWFFETGGVSHANAELPPASEPRSPVVPTAYQIWASHRQVDTSVLIEESPGPLSAPAWSPRPGFLAYRRFVLSTSEPGSALARGRVEVVVQSSLNQKRVLWTSPSCDLPPDRRTDFCSQAPAWSPDGKLLALDSPVKDSAIIVLSAESGRLVATYDDAMLPSWSTDGSRIAFLRSHEDGTYGVWVGEVRGQSFGAPRKLRSRGAVKTRPCWSNDGRSIMVMTEKVVSRPRELAIERIAVETPEPAQALITLLTEPILRNTSVRSAVLEFDHDGEGWFFAIEMAGRDSELGIGILTGPQLVKRFHPLDGSLRIMSIGVSPDNRSLALRFGGPESLTPPLVYDLVTEQIHFILADESSRRAWMEALITTAQSALIAKLPPVMVHGQLGKRPTLLPIPGDFAGNDALRSRVARIARLAEPLFAPAARAAGRAGADDPDAFTLESRLFFSYLADDFATAATCLDAIQPLLTEPADRFALLSVRAQILWSRGDPQRAKAIVDYLQTIAGTSTRNVEDTPAGPAISEEPDPRGTWARYVASHAAEMAKNPINSSPEHSEELDEIRIQSPFAPAGLEPGDNR